MDDAEREMFVRLTEYDVGEELGRGRYGIVASGRHRHLDRDVAIKALPVVLALDPVVRSRFVAEARVLAAMNHPHIVPIYDYVEQDGLCLLVMQKLPGGSISSQFEEQGLTMEATCVVLLAVCAGLHYAHQKGVLHRDVKPENLLYSSTGVLKITDFGLAKIVGGADTLATRTGVILGTVAYMAPEQIAGGKLGPAADIYAAGVVLYELLSGELPFLSEGGNLAIAHRHASEEPIPLEQVAPSVPPELLAVTMRALARSPADRFPTAEAFGVAIGAAATRACGSNWLQRAGLEVIDNGPISASANRRTPLTDPRSRPGPEPPRPLPPSVAEVAPPLSPPWQALIDEPIVGEPESEPGEERVQLRSIHRLDLGHATFDLGQEELVPLRELVEPPPRPFALAATSLGLALLTLAIVIAGVGAAKRGGPLPPGAARVANSDVAQNAASAIPIDLRNPILIQVSPQKLAATKAQLVFSVAGIDVASSRVVPLVVSRGEFAQTVDMRPNRFLVGGNVTADLRLSTTTGTLVDQRFSALLAQPPFVTIAGVAILLILLFLLNCAGLLLRHFGHGRFPWSGGAGMVVVGLALGPTAVAFRWLLPGPEPTSATLIVATVGALGASLTAALAAWRIGRRAEIPPRTTPWYARSTSAEGS